VNGGYTVHVPAVDGGLYMLKEGKTVNEPGELLLIKNDPKYNEQWPRALVPYKRIHGIGRTEATHASRKRRQSSRNTYPPARRSGWSARRASTSARATPNGIVKPGTVTAAFAGGTDATGTQDLDPFNTALDGVSLNWFNQGADAGGYTNDDIHAVRILAMEPATDRNKGPQSGRTFRSHATERLRILGEIPPAQVRRREATDRPRRQPGHELPREDTGGRGLHIPNA